MTPPQSWLTTDHVVQAAGAIGAIVAAFAASWGVWLTKRDQRAKDRAGLPRWIFGASSEIDETGWRYAALERKRADPQNHFLVQFSLGRRFLMTPARDNPAFNSPTPGPRPRVVPSSELPARLLKGGDFQWRNQDNTVDRLEFFFRPAGWLWWKSNRISVRVTLEEMSPSRRKTKMPIKSNPIDWSASATISQN